MHVPVRVSVHACLSVCLWIPLSKWFMKHPAYLRVSLRRKQHHWQRDGTLLWIFAKATREETQARFNAMRTINLTLISVKVCINIRTLRLAVFNLCPNVSSHPPVHSGWGGCFCVKIFLHYFLYCAGFKHDYCFTISQLSPGSSCIPLERPHGKPDRTSQELPLCSKGKRGKRRLTTRWHPSLIDLVKHCKWYCPAFHWTMIPE